MPSSYQRSFDFTSAVTVTLWTTVPFEYGINWIGSKNRCLKENVFEWCLEMNEFCYWNNYSPNRYPIHNQHCYIQVSMHKQLLEICVLFHFNHCKSNRLCCEVGRAHQHCQPHNGESHKYHDAWKKNVFCHWPKAELGSTGGYPERERTFSQKHSVKRRRINELLASTCPIIKRPAISYVLLKHHKTLNSFKAMIDVHKRTSFLEFTVCFSLQCEFW